MESQVEVGGISGATKGRAPVHAKAMDALRQVVQLVDGARCLLESLRRRCGVLIALALCSAVAAVMITFDAGDGWVLRAMAISGLLVLQWPLLRFRSGLASLLAIPDRVTSTAGAVGAAWSESTVAGNTLRRGLVPGFSTVRAIVGSLRQLIQLPGLPKSALGDIAEVVATLNPISLNLAFVSGVIGFWVTAVMSIVVIYQLIMFLPS